MNGPPQMRTLGAPPVKKQEELQGDIRMVVKVKSVVVSTLRDVTETR